MPSKSEIRVVLVTHPEASGAADLVRRLVQEGLAACGNVVPGLTSIYRWEGEVQEDPEVLVVLKTVGEQVPALIERTSELHPYEVPEILALAVSESLPAYAAWVMEESVPTSTERTVAEEG